MKWYFAALEKYAAFNGRARRKEFWYFVLFNVLINIVLVVVDGVIGTLSLEDGIGLLSGLYSLTVLVPSIAVSVRRLHDTDRSGWWLLINLIPISGAIAFLVFSVQEGAPGQNRYGFNPKEAAV